MKTEEYTQSEIERKKIFNLYCEDRIKKLNELGFYTFDIIKEIKIITEIIKDNLEIINEYENKNKKITNG